MMVPVGVCAGFWQPLHIWLDLTKLFSVSNTTQAHTDTHTRRSTLLEALAKTYTNACEHTHTTSASPLGSGRTDRNTQRGSGDKAWWLKLLLIRHWLFNPLSFSLASLLTHHKYTTVARKIYFPHVLTHAQNNRVDDCLNNHFQVWG